MLLGMVDAAQEGDVIGCLFCRKSGHILFFLNGEPMWKVRCPEIALVETAANSSPRGDAVGRRDSDWEAEGGLQGPQGPQGHRSSVASKVLALQDMYVTIGVLGKGELEINFGGKSFNLSGEITKVSKGLVQSTAPIAARAFGYRLARFHIMLVSLQGAAALSAPKAYTLKTRREGSAAASGLLRVKGSRLRD